MDKIKYTKLNRILYNKLSNINCIKNLKFLKLNNNKVSIIYDNITEYVKILIKPSIFLKLNNKELIKIKKKLKSGYLILSTPFGVLTDKKALIHKTGGIILCYIK